MIDGTTNNHRPDVITRAANLVLSISAGLCFLLFLLMIGRHGWSWQYVLFLALAGILAGSLRFPGPIKVNLTLVLYSLMVCGYLAEAVLALNPVSQQLSFFGAGWLPKAFGENAGMTKMQVESARKQHVEFDVRSRLSVIMDLRRDGRDAWPSVPATALYKDWQHGSSLPVITIEGVGVMPLGGIANKRTVYCNENGTHTIYDADEHGFHNPGGQWTASEHSLAAVGDSFVQGACVPTDKNFVALLRQRFPKTLNVGRGGNGPLSELASIKEYVSIVKPSLVFWFYFEENDLIEDFPIELRNPILREYVKEGFSQGLIGKQAAIDQALIAHIDAVQKTQGVAGRMWSNLTEPRSLDEIIGQLEQRVKLSSLRETITGLIGRESTQPGEHDLQVHPPVSEETIHRFRDVLAEAQRSIQAWGGTLVFVYLPQWERYADVEYASKDRTAVLATARSLSLPIIDMHPVFAAHPDPVGLFPFRERGHYTEEGHRIVAEELIHFASGLLGASQAGVAGQEPPAAPAAQ